MKTKELIGRIVFLERPAKSEEHFLTVGGVAVTCTPLCVDSWVVSSSTSLPWRLSDEKGDAGTYYVQSRVIRADMLKPITDPGIDIDDEEVRALYGDKFHEKGSV